MKKSSLVLKALCVALVCCLCFPFSASATTALRRSPSFSANFSTAPFYSKWGNFWLYGPRNFNIEPAPPASNLQVYGSDGSMVFKNRSYFDPSYTPDFNASYSYYRLSSPFVEGNPLGGDSGATLEFSVRLDYLPINNLASTNKGGQTGLVFNVRMNRWNEEFYFCIFGSGTDANGVTNKIKVSSYDCDRDSIDFEAPKYSGDITLSTGPASPFHKFTFVYDRDSIGDLIFVYIDGVQQYSFSRPTHSRSDGLAKDFVCVSLINRSINASFDGYGICGDSEVTLDYINIYNYPIYPYASSVNTPLFGQTLNNTCASASARMLLTNHGVEVSEEAITAKADYFGNPTSREDIVKAINFFLQQAGSSAVYAYTTSSQGYGNITQFRNKIQSSLSAGRAVQTYLKITSQYSSYFGYTAPGHSVVITGIKQASNGTYFLEILDPFDGDSTNNEYDGQLLRVPLSVVHSCFLLHSHTLIYQV